MSPFETAARDFIASRNSEKTKDAYRRDLGKWLAYCERAGVDPARPSRADATAFRDELARGCAAQTVRRILTSLSASYKAALDLEAPAASWNPFSPRALARPPADDVVRTAAVEAEVAEAVVAQAEADATPIGVRDAAILRLLRSTGLRRAEVAGLRRAAVRWRGTEAVVQVTVKGGKVDESAVPESAATALRRWLGVAPASEWVFPGPDPERPLGANAVTKMVATRARRAEVAHVHPHQLRAAFATDGLDVMPLHEVQASMHHHDPRTTLRYDRRARGAGVAAAIEARRKKAS